MRDSILKMLASALLAAIPFALQAYISSIAVWMAGVGILGAAAGYAFGFPAAGGGVVGVSAGQWFLTRAGVIGNGSDGDTFYLVGGCGAAVFVLSAVMGALLHWSTSRTNGARSVTGVSGVG